MVAFAVDNGLSLQPAPSKGQVTNFTKRNIFASPTLDFIHPSILTRDVSDSYRPIPPAMRLLSRGKTYHPGNTVAFKKHLPESLEQADLCVGYYGAVTSIPGEPVPMPPREVDTTASSFGSPTPYPGRTSPVTKE
ncbi:BQ5605_C004g03046 [Microbotryum silenes-dioicae]|uniref:BQ5605_C004g03046 protein n=1 Tax=Microbotryum silenes-dioicae TaxID=796604 RepID=A0A2X0PBJ8_9BASI|nr:BQ5605_C004g03046 [Microbotryum silenes-dioicae]